METALLNDEAPAAGAERDGAVVRATGMRKSFGGVEVLHGVDLDLRPGEVHALLGENGAGKSTIINLLSGRLAPDAGRIELAGRPVAFANPLAARRAGVSIIAQELELVPTLSIVENVFLGVEPTRYGLIRWGDARRQVRTILAELGVAADPDRIAGTMSVADQQLVEIAKAIIGDFRVLIMDEPTSALNLEDTERLFKIVRRLKSDGVAILYVSHRLWEVFEISDRISVLRDGTKVLAERTEDTDVDTVIRAMLGEKSSLIRHAKGPRGHAEAAAPRPSTPVLRLENVSSGDVLRDISLTVHAGEVVGVAGVLGSGRTELCEAVYGLRPVDRGALHLKGTAVAVHEPKDSLRHGVFLLPEDRKSEGIFGHLDVRENVILGYAGAPGTGDAGRAPNRLGGLVPTRGAAERSAFQAMRTALGIKCAGPAARVTQLSGGNQQKALFARGVLSEPVVMILSEPTRGVDVGAKEEIYSAIDGFADRGIATLVSSSEIGELLRLSDRIYVLRNGQVVAELAAAATSEEEILKLMAG